MNAGSKEMTRCIDPGKERVAPVEQALRTPRHDAAALLVPRRLQQLRLHLARAGDDLAQILDRALSVAELAAHLQLSREQVTEGLFASNGYTVSSLDAQSADKTNDGATIVERLGRTDPGLAGIDILTSLKPLIAKLTDRERAILSLRFVRDMTQTQIGARLGISQMHVSRLLTRALDRLRAQLLDEE